MTTTITKPVSDHVRDLLLKDIQGYSYQAEDREARAQAAFSKSAEFHAKAQDCLVEAQEYRDKIADTLRVIELIDNHNLNFPDSTQSKEN